MGRGTRDAGYRGDPGGRGGGLGARPGAVADMVVETGVQGHFVTVIPQKLYKLSEVLTMALK